MDDFAGDDGQSQRRLWADYAYAGLSCVTFWLTDDTISITIDQGVDFRVEVADMFIGPVNLGVDAIERITHRAQSERRRPDGPLCLLDLEAEVLYHRVGE